MCIHTQQIDCKHINMKLVQCWWLIVLSCQYLISWQAWFCLLVGFSHVIRFFKNLQQNKFMNEICSICKAEHRLQNHVNVTTLYYLSQKDSAVSGSSSSLSSRLPSPCATVTTLKRVNWPICKKGKNGKSCNLGQ